MTPRPWLPGLLLSGAVLGLSGCGDEANPPASNGGSSNAGSAGSAATGGAGAASGGSASGSSGATTGGAGMSGAAAGGASGAPGGNGGTAGSAGQGGGGAAAAPEAELDGAGWTFECTKAQDGNLCEVMPPGQSTCPQGGFTIVDETLQFGGTAGTLYDVTIRFQGTHEAGDYTGGTASPAQFLKGATHTDGGLHTWLSLEVSDPPATYNPNSGGGGGSVQIYDYSATIQIAGGATIKLKGHDIDCLMHRYCQNDITNPCKGLALGDISPAADPIDGAFLHMDVTSVIAK